MPSSFTTSLRLTLPVTGENSGTWGDLVNTGITNLVDASIAGYAAVTMTDANYTLTSVNGAADEARKMLLNISGTLTAARNVICPTASKLYFVKNATAGGFAITLKTSAGTGISIPNGLSMVLMCDGTNVREATDFTTTVNTTNLAYTGTLTGGTGIVNLGSGQFYKDASGNVGVGTSGPGAKMEVSTSSAGATVQALRLSNSAAGVNTKAQLGFTVAGGTFYAAINGGYGASSPEMNFVLPSGTPGIFTWVDNATERMRIDSSGNVGVGTAAPSSYGKLAVVGAQTGYVTSAVSNSNSATNDGVKLVTSFGTTQIGSYGHYWTGSAFVNDLNFYSTLTVSQGASERMRIDSSGSVGIGATPTAGYKLDIYNSANNLVVIRSAGTSSASLELAANGNTAGVGGLNIQQNSSNNAFIVNGSAAAMVFGTSNTERMRIESGGNVGIGIAGSATKLDVRGATAQLLDVQNTGGLGAEIRLFDTGYSSGISTNNGTLIFGTNGASTERMRIDTGGNVLVGTTSTTPSSSNGVIVSVGAGNTAFMHTTGTVTGTLYQGFYLGGTAIGTITQSGTTAVLYNTTSDGRLKTNITPAADAGALLDAVQVRQFDWLADDTHQRYGFIAQELVEVVPEAVHVPANLDDMMAVDYSKLVPLLVKEIQSLRARVAALEL